jgi:hypothetical protein
MLCDVPIRQFFGRESIECCHGTYELTVARGKGQRPEGHSQDTSLGEATFDSNVSFNDTRRTFTN